VADTADRPVGELAGESGQGTSGTPIGVAILIVVGLIVVFSMLALSFWGGDGGRAAHAEPAFPGDASAVSADLPGAYPVAPPPWRGEEIREMLADTGKPCSGCHNEEMPANPERRKLEMAHEDIVLHHGEEHRWCLDCHDADNRDKLRLASGALIDFTESQRLCGQCHGDRYRDWRLGIHGRRIGMWNGEKEYRLCVHCHWAHAPRYAPLAPLPAPKRPGAIR
jgi:hypothetical protein